MNTHILFRDVVGMPNDTSCSPTSNCTILEGASTNGTYYVAQYDPNFPVPYWHKNMELATIIVCNSLTRKLTRYRAIEFSADCDVSDCDVGGGLKYELIMDSSCDRGEVRISVEEV